MKNNGTEMTEKELIKEALNHISDACCFLFETDSSEGHALAFMCDSMLKYGQVIYNDDNPIDATSDFNAYEQRKFDAKHKSKINVME
jgi:hypothetical protein